MQAILQSDSLYFATNDFNSPFTISGAYTLYTPLSYT